MNRQALKTLENNRIESNYCQPAGVSDRRCSGRGSSSTRRAFSHSIPISPNRKTWRSNRCTDFLPRPAASLNSYRVHAANVQATQSESFSCVYRSMDVIASSVTSLERLHTDHPRGTRVLARVSLALTP